MQFSCLDFKLNELLELILSPIWSFILKMFVLDMQFKWFKLKTLIKCALIAIMSFLQFVDCWKSILFDFIFHKLEYQNIYLIYFFYLILLKILSYLNYFKPDSLNSLFKNISSNFVGNLFNNWLWFVLSAWASFYLTISNMILVYAY